MSRLELECSRVSKEKTGYFPLPWICLACCQKCIFLLENYFGIIFVYFYWSKLFLPYLQKKMYTYFKIKNTYKTVFEPHEATLTVRCMSYMLDMKPKHRILCILYHNTRYILSCVDFNISENFHAYNAVILYPYQV